MALRRARREHHKHAPGTSQATLRPSVNNEVLHPICPKRLAPAPRLRGSRGCDHGPHRAQQHLRRERRPQHARTHRRPGQGLNPRAVRLQWPPTARQHGTERQYRRPRTAIFNGPQTGKYSASTCRTDPAGAFCLTFGPCSRMKAFRFLNTL